MVVVAAARAWAVAASAAVVVFAWVVAASAAVEFEWQGPVSEALLLGGQASASEVLEYIAGSAPEFARPESVTAMLVV